jgi:hypothetical protein
MAHRLLVLVLVAMAMLELAVSQTAPPDCPMALEYNIVEAMLASTTVVYGKFLNTSGDGTQGQFMVYCAVKSNQELPELVTIKDAVREDKCALTKLEVDTEYLVLLKQTEEEGLAQDMFRLQEKTISTPAAYAPTPRNLQYAANLCGIRESSHLKEPKDRTQTAKKCPVRTATTENCEMGHVAGGQMVTSSWLLLFLTGLATISRLI